MNMNANKKLIRKRIKNKDYVIIDNEEKHIYSSSEPAINLLPNKKELNMNNTKSRKSDIQVKDKETLIQKYLDLTGNVTVHSYTEYDPFIDVEDRDLYTDDGVQLTDMLLFDKTHMTKLISPDDMKHLVDKDLYKEVLTSKEYIEKIKKLPKDYLLKYIQEFEQKIKLLEDIECSSIDCNYTNFPEGYNMNNVLPISLDMLKVHPSRYILQTEDITSISPIEIRDRNTKILNTNKLIDYIVQYTNVGNHSNGNEYIIKQVFKFCLPDENLRPSILMLGVYHRESTIEDVLHEDNLVGLLMIRFEEVNFGITLGIQSLDVFYNHKHKVFIDNFIIQLSRECITLIVQEPLTPKSDKTYWINIVGTSQEGFELNQIECDITDQNDYEYSILHYGKSFKEFDDGMVHRLVDNSNTGSNLFMLYGEPGTGKTFYLKNLMSRLASRTSFIFIPPNMVDVITDPSFFSWLTGKVREFREDGNNVVLIIEEAEQLLLSRDNGNTTSGVSALLNLGDGIISDIMNVKIITTFNCSIDKIDKALLRPGRLSIKKKFGYLTKKQVIDLLKVKNIDVNDPNVIQTFGLDSDGKNYKRTIAEFYNEFNEEVNQLVFDEDFDYDFEKEGDSESFKSNKEKDVIL